MRGDLRLDQVKTRQDFETLSEENKITFKSFLKATIDRQTDIQEYPEGYWELNLKEGDEGYIAPILKDIKDFTVIERFGFTEEEL